VTDLLSALLYRYDRPSYLELGVSAGKNLYALAPHVQDLGGTITGVDIEERSPVLDGIRMRYVRGDLLKPAAWDALAGGCQYDLVFSDACHTPEALRREGEELRRGLLSRRGTIVWDDIEGNAQGPMWDEVRRIADALRAGPHHMLLNGWLGEHEGPHGVAMVMR